MPRDFQLPGRSPVIACNGMAATSHPLATLTAIDTLRAGGNAVDAAVAACAVLGVVEPQSTGIGGDCFCMISQPGKPVWGYNGCGRAGAKASTEALLKQGMHAIGMTSPHAVTVPGAIEAWDVILKAHGRFGLDRALEPAIRFAEDGFPVASRISYAWANMLAKLAADPGAARHFLFGGRAPLEGDVVKLPALAATMRTIAQKGWRAFYEGEIAQDMAKTLAARGSFLSEEDFANHRGEVATPISTNYRGLDILELPPNGQGLTALVLLNILENFDMAALAPLGPERFHVVLEAARMAYGVRDAHIADPAYMRVKVSDLLDKTFAKRLAGKIDRAHVSALPSAPTPDSDTVYLTVVDRDRMAVSFINSLFSNFGVGICTEKTGIMLNNRGGCFVVDPTHPNTFGAQQAADAHHHPGARHARRPQRHELRRHGFALSAHGPRPGRTQHGRLRHGRAAGDRLSALLLRGRGRRWSSAARRRRPSRGSKARGHRVEFAATPWGGGQTIKIDWERGVLIGGSEPRKDGCALGY